MSDPLLEVNKVSFQYGKEKIFKDLSFAIQDQEFISVVGPSGSGKTTLFRLVLGLEEPTTGELLLKGEPIKLRNGSIGYVPQKDLLVPWRTIIDNVILPLELKGVQKKEAYEKAAPLFASFGLEGTERLYPAMLSGGMKQRVSFMRAYLTGADILLLDEPFSALDAISRLAMQEWLLDQWKLLKKTIVLITHDLDEALLLSDRIFVTTLPPMTMLKEVPIPLSRPRTMEDIMNNSFLLSAKRELIQQFRKEGDIFDKRIK